MKVRNILALVMVLLMLLAMTACGAASMDYAPEAMDNGYGTKGDYIATEDAAEAPSASVSLPENRKLIQTVRMHVETEDLDANRFVQGISEDGKLMITIAREEGVDWNPLKDLTAKAYFILAEDFELPPVKIFLEKTSPVGAGLGGGSSDAAFALKMLNELCSLNLTESQLAAYAARLGSDCAFFIYNRPMMGQGRGEILTEYQLDLEGYEIQVLTPAGIAVSTADAYRGIVPKLPQVALSDVLTKPVEQWKDMLVNDFEETVFAKYPELAAIKMSLYECGAVYASMSGSGSALFAIYKKD
jgi:4-diphosphocytidyl-2-C-methyl-D-erythritol kinase